MNKKQQNFLEVLFVSGAIGLTMASISIFIFKTETNTTLLLSGLCAWSLFDHLNDYLNK